MNCGLQSAYGCKVGLQTLQGPGMPGDNSFPARHNVAGTFISCRQFDGKSSLKCCYSFAMLPCCLLVVHNCISRASLSVAFAFQQSLKFSQPRLHAVGRGSEILHSRFEKGVSNYTTYDLATLPSETSQGAQPRASTSAAPPRPPTVESQEGKQASRTAPATGPRTTQAQPSVQEEGSGYLSTESDSDTGTNKKTQVCL